MVLLEQADVPMLPMHDFESILGDPHLVATGFFQTCEHPSEGTIRTMRMPMSWSDSSPDPVRPAPRLGEHSREVLREAGYDDGQIDQLVARQAVHVAPALSSPATPSPSATA